MSITPIAKPLPGEHVVALSPENATEAAIAWLARPNVFAGRALTAPTMEKRQRWQAGRIALRGQSLTSGVDSGLEVGHEILKPKDAAPYVRLVIGAGLGIAASGEDVVLAQPAHVDLLGLPVYAEPSIEGSATPDAGGALPAEGSATPGTGTDNVPPKAQTTDTTMNPKLVDAVPATRATAASLGTAKLTIGALPPMKGVILPPVAPKSPSGNLTVRERVILERDLGTLLQEKPGAIANVGVLILQPVKIDRLGEFDPTDPCELAPCAETGDDELAFEDWRIADGVRAVWYAWPGEWHALPGESTSWRNRIAWTIFRAESELAPGELLPWETLGVPVALIALDADLNPLFIDRASVVREGGRSRNPRLAFTARGIDADWRRPALWQAQIEQLAETVAAAGDPAPTAETLRAMFDLLPPASILPTNVIDLTVLPLNSQTEKLESAFFPADFELDAVPIPLESLDLAIREAAPLAPLDVHTADRVRVLVPVPQAVFEPRLLIEEVIDPEFDATLQRFLLARARALGAREGLRKKISELVRLATGRAVPIPALGDDAGALETETLQPWGPPPAGGGHRSTIAAGWHQHFFTGATATLQPAAADSLYVHTYLDPDNPPRVLMFQWFSGNWEHRAYWCAAADKGLVTWGTDNTASRRYMGELPTAGDWIRLSVTGAQVALGGLTITGMAFSLFDGRAAFGATGKLVGGVEQAWFSETLPAGATAAPKSGLEEDWTFLTHTDLYAPFEGDFGFDLITSANEPLGANGDIDEFLKDPIVTEVANDAGVLTGKERGELGKRGLEGFIALLKARADRADDIVDYGFVKVQTDTYRIRQLMLGTTNATKLAVSPTLATIAQADTAVASQERISTFFDQLKQAPAAQVQPAAKLLAGASDHESSALATFNTISFIKPPSIAPVTTIVRSNVSGPYIPVSRQKAVNLNIGTQKVLSGLGASLAFTPQSIINSSPLIGKASIRTVTVAKRLDDPKAVEARNYVMGTRYDTVQAIARLAADLSKEDGGALPGLFAGVSVFGIEDDPFLENSGDPTRRTVALKTLLAAGPARIAKLLDVPDRDGDEALHFSDAADISDTTVALLRQMEGRIQVYRDAAAACERVLEALREDTDAARRALAAWDEHLAEARQDVSVARALIAEENARLAAINARRSEVLKKEVRFLAYIRPREVHNLADTPLRTLDPGLIEAPVPACLAEHNDIPDELHDILGVVREAPVAWFPAAPKLVEKLDRHDLLIRAAQSAQVRGVAYAGRLPPTAVSAAATAVRNAIANVQARTLKAVGETRLLAANINVAQLATLSYQGARAQVEQVVSLGDLIDGEHGRGEVSKKAAELFDRLSRIAGCLHAEFSAVLPSIRLDWAETLSQFDASPNLRDLSVLARWSEIEFIDRRQMQAYADFLFDQVDARVGAAESLMNDVVRMCLLLAADAPIGRILAGRLPRPAVVRPGVRLPLTAFDVSKLRVGMHALVYRGGDVVARAVVEDIGSEISARVVYTEKAEESLGTESRVQFADAAQVSVKRTPAARSTR